MRSYFFSLFIGSQLLTSGTYSTTRCPATALPSSSPTTKPHHSSFPACNNVNMIYNPTTPGAYSAKVFCQATTSSNAWEFWCNTGGKGLISGYGIAGTRRVVNIDCTTYTPPAPDVPLSRCPQDVFTAVAGNVYELTCDSAADHQTSGTSTSHVPAPLKSSLLSMCQVVEA